jgi:hypothetical protein
MSVRNIVRRSTISGVATPTNAPVYVDSDDNKLKMIPAGSGTTEVEVADVSSSQTFTNKTLTAPVITSPIINRTPVTLAAATLSLTQALHDGKTVVVTKTDGTTITLPAATGTGARFRIVQGAKVASVGTVVQVASATDYFRGAQYAATDNGSGAGLTWPTANTATVATESDTITWDGSTKGGNIGDVIELEDIATAVWLLKAFVDATGTEATPFSVAV